MLSLSAADYRALAAFRYAIRRFQHFSEAAARRAGLEPQQHQLLLAIRGAPPGETATIGWIAERLQVRHHSVVGLVDRLAARRLVSRSRDPEDHRRVRITLTPNGQRLLHRLSLAHWKELRSGARGLLETLRVILRSSRRRR
jgi:DNA-binding MarR family transcriptional regulator